MATTKDPVEIIFIVPAYNEEANIGTCIERMLALPPQVHVKSVIVVDDGSKDRTKEIALSYRDRIPVTVISHGENQGVGQVFRTGFGAVVKIASPSDVIITIEADNTGDILIVPKMARLIVEGTDLALASCYARGGGVRGTKWFRILLSKSANLLMKFVAPWLKVATYSSFYRAYRPQILTRAMEKYQERFIEEPGFICMVEVLIKISRLTREIREVPMVLSVNERIGPSKMKIMRTAMSYLRFIVHLLIHPPRL